MNQMEELAGVLARAVSTAWTQELERDNRRWEPAACYASQRRTCVRAMALDLIAWDQKPNFEADQLERMRRGKERETSIVARLNHVGEISTPRFKVIHQQISESLKDRQGRVIIRMRIDGRLEFETRETPPFEIKSGMLADTIHTLEDCEKSPWTRHWPDQILCYLLAHNEPFGFLILETRGTPRLIPVFLEQHLERAESFLVDAERAMDAKAGRAPLPQYIEDASECRRCAHFGRACNPPLNFEGVQVIADGELETALRRRQELAPLAAEYRKIDEALKDRFKGTEHAICGGFEVSGKLMKRKGYAVEASEYWQVKIDALQPNGAKDAA